MSQESSFQSSRRQWLRRVALAPLAAALPLKSIAEDKLPDARAFEFEGTYLNGAFMHPMSLRTAEAARAYMSRRVRSNQETDDLMGTHRTEAARLFAKIIHAQPEDLTWVPSTMAGENFVTAGLGYPASKAPIVTDAFHFHGSLYLYHQLASQGVPVTTVKPVNNRIELEDLDKAIRPGTGLVAVSLVSATTGFQHDLRKICELAHSRGAMVFADIIQAAGAVPIDVVESGVDFCACSSYKWLMADFGAGFLYVRKDRLERMKRSQYGFRQIEGSNSHVFPFDTPGDKLFDFTAREDATGKFQVGTLSNATIAALKESLAYIDSTGVQAIEAWRKPFLRKLQEELPRYGYLPMTPVESVSPIVVFALEHAAERLQRKLEQAQISISVYPSRIRISPSVYNTMDDIEKLISVLKTV
ncbi:MAG: aminotransferase class V-fold PLP-dependent enzyme [Cyclobacteriaceae bacterium]|nr:aminotransferase class V-fold PLP-dependent enzyme [Cyclobacteriaceae bacterium]